MSDSNWKGKSPSSGSGSKAPSRVPGIIRKVHGAQYPPPSSAKQVEDFVRSSRPHYFNTSDASGSSTEGGASSSVPQTSKEAPLVRSRKANRLEKFRRLLDAENADLVALRDLCWTGVPDEVRPVCWQLLMGYLPANRGRRPIVLERKRKEYKDIVTRYYDNPQRTDQCNAILHQIEIDVPRTNPDIPLFKHECIKQAMIRCLYVWSIRHPASGYVQGINDLLTPFFVVFLAPHVDCDVLTCDVKYLTDDAIRLMESDSYWCVSKLLDGIQSNYTFAQPGIQRMVFRLREVVHRVDEPLYNHLADQSADFMQFAFRWMNCLLMREFTMAQVIRLWDAYVGEAEDLSGFHVYVCAALLCRFSEQLRQLEFQDLFLMLQHLPTQTWGDSEVGEILAQAFVWKSLFKDARSHLETL